MDEDGNGKEGKPSRREFIKGAGAGAAVAAIAVAGAEEMRALFIRGSEDKSSSGTGSSTTSSPPPPLRPVSYVRLLVNGVEYGLDVDNRWSLADVLRERLNLIGTKLGCDRGDCGACAVLVEGVPMLSCMMLAVEWQGHALTTVEGIGMPESLSAIQTSLIDTDDGVQCGACLPGIVVTSTAFLKGHPGADEAALKAALAGNLCKCGNWPKMIAGLVAVRG
jgi:xanthine dehydrogenase YagT iron-sulfur-binding subunit